MSAEEEIKKSKKRTSDDGLKEEKKHKKHKKDKKEKKEKKDKKDKKDKKEKKEKKDKKDKKHDDTEETETKSKDSKSVFTSSSSEADIKKFLKDNEVEIKDPSSSSQLQPVLSFSEVNVDSRIQKCFSGFKAPTPIQAASWPYLFNDNDVIGVAETGSGKTFAFAVPAINHVLNTKYNKGKPQILVVSPTRELAIQIYDNYKILADATNTHCCCVYGGVPKDQQRQDIKISNTIIATPGRLIDLLEEGSIDLSDVSYLVLDEADRMLEKGFEEDIKKILSSTKTGNRQTVMFTATWPEEVRKLASSFMNEPVKVTIGNRDELTANKRITQIVEVIDPDVKERRLFELLKQYHKRDDPENKILIFALYKKEAARIERALVRRGYQIASVHGDLSQSQRTVSLKEFKEGKKNIMLATDVAARGLDIPNVKTVINLTFPLTAEDYVHRIGRTGRAGKTGVAHTLFTDQEKHLSGALINILNGANQAVPEELLKFGSHTKKKAHSAYGAFFKDVDMSKKATKIKFD
ncbi:RNA-dependent ATPase [Saccharomycopsis crataegensis]|uniref:ATP-dependent RNA helicase DBP3 n=1 Tax=Saccharomycopsis crataegensis TaxID=43959 RepID=A0AAV5QF75_9ASCO|nr:RNA-dependent ATPase [Saccharomycopsis crataegensis]